MVHLLEFRAARRPLAVASIALVVAAFVAPADAAPVTHDGGVITDSIEVNLNDDAIFNNTTSAGPGYKGTLVVGDHAVSSITVNGRIIRDANGDYDRQAIFIGDTLNAPINVGTLTNNGSIESLGLFGTGVVIWGNVDHILNNGLIRGGGASGMYVLGAPTLVENRGTITGQFYGFGSNGAFGGSASLYNGASGVISATGDYHISDPTLRDGSGVVFRENANVTNDGTISSQFATGLILGNGSVTNSGLITGVVGIREQIGLDQAQPSGPYNPAMSAIPYTSLSITNAGRIVGTGGTAIDFGVAASTSTLTLLNGSVITGAVDFGGGTDTLDISQFTGNMVLDTQNLENLKVDGSGPVSFSTFNSAQQSGKLIARQGGTIAVIDAPSAGGGSTATSAAVSNVTTEVANIVSTQLGDTTGGPGDGGAPGGGDELGYAPTPHQTSAQTAVMTELDVGKPAPPRNKVWISGFGGGSADLTGTPLSSLFGGIVAGSHAQLDAHTHLGLMAGYVRSNLDINTGQQTIDTSTALLGAYGRSQLDPVTIDFAVLGGYGFNHSARDTGGGGIASADFSSWFLAPELGLSVPVLSGDGRSVSFGVRAKYITGAVQGYTETGSLANLTLGVTPISLLDGRIEISGTTPLGADPSGAKAFAKAGLFAQSNLGGTAVQIGVLGQTFTSIAPNTVLYGSYGSVGVDVPLSTPADLSLSLNGSARNDGMVSVSGKAQLTGAF